MFVQEPVQAAIWHCLNHYDHKNAVFLAERLCNEVESDDTIFILATSYYRSNLINQTYWLLREKARRAPQCRFLLAKSAYQLEKYVEAENALGQSTFFCDTNHNLEEVVKEFGEIACFVLQLMAKIYIKTERTKLAIVALKRALELNPFLWQAYAELCHLGENPDGNSIFKITSTSVFTTCHGNINTSSMVFGVCQVSDGNSGNVVLGSNGSNNIVNQLPNNSNYIFTTPVDQCIPQHSIKAIQASHFTQNSMGTPYQSITNHCNLNNSSSLLRGSNTNNYVTTVHNGISNSSTTMMLDDSQIGSTINTESISNCNSDNGGGVGNGNSSGSNSVGNDMDLHYRKSFKYLSKVSPISPIFGVLPITNPLGVGNNDSSINAPSSQTLAEMNQEHNIINKKNKNHLINRKDTSLGSGGTNRPTVFAQTGNITPRTSNNNNESSIPNSTVRRSSRLFGNNAYSVKENTKSPNIGNKLSHLRSPPRKLKSSRTAKICLNNELMEDKSNGAISSTMPCNHSINSARKGKEKIETITSASTTLTSGGCASGCYRSNPMDQEAKVQLNNSFNNAQTLNDHLMSLKKQSADGLMNLLRDLSEGYKQLVHYKCKAAIRHFESVIPKNHLCSSWVQSLIGVCYYELKEYESAVRIFKQIHEENPYRLDFMEIYSSSLWHLQKDIDLSALAQDLINQDKLSPVTWCVAGNCFSLHKEHETAIKFFKRAIQVDKDFVYSYTLLGHELVLTEELDKAMDYFRSALFKDPRHYNAWFGIGTIYSKQEEYKLAELHYIKALQINPQNSVIMVHIGAVQYKMQKKEQALRTLDTAVNLDPNNPLARFHRSSVNFALGKHQEALNELEQLKEWVPKESAVFYLIGKIHKSLGNDDLALMHFSWAADLDPKGANNKVKDAFDSVSPPTTCAALNEPSLVDPADLDPISERSNDSIQAHDVNYDSDF